MRIRDLRWQILAAVVLIISYAAIAFCYYIPVRAKAETFMGTLAMEETRTDANMIQTSICSYYDRFANFETDEDYDESILKPSVSTIDPYRFTKYVDEIHKDSLGKPITRYYTIGRGTMVEGNSTMDSTVYIYFWNGIYTDLEADTYARYGKVKFSEIMYQISTNCYVFTDESSNGLLLYNNVNDKANVIMGADGLSGSSSYSELWNFGSSLNNKAAKTNEVCKRYTMNGKSGTLSATPLLAFCDSSTTKAEASQVYLGTFVELDATTVNWVLEQSIQFYIIGVIVCVLMLGIMIWGVFVASRLLRADRKSTQATKAIVIRIDPKGKVIFTNKTFKKLYGVTKLPNIDLFIDVETNEPAIATIKQNKAFECSVPINYAEEDERLIYLHLSPLYISSSYYLMGTDITIDYLRRQHLEVMSGRNEYTNCENSFTLANQFNHIVSNVIGEFDLAFVEYNIHKFNDIIQVFGRTNYNILLNEVLAVLKEYYENLEIFHMSDSKFMIVYPNNMITDVTSKIDKSLERFRRPFTVKQNNIYVNFKVVVYNIKSVDLHEATLDNIRTKLDLAYRNITDFSNKDYVVYDPAMDKVIFAAEEMEKDIENGLANREFKMYLQPQFDVFANRIDGFEALIRWVNPKYIDKSPQVYIEIAEQRGHMLDIGRFVISESFRLAKKLEPYKVHISVNVSPVQLLQVGFVQQVIDEFKSLELKRGSVAIEITETFLMGNFNLINEKLKILKENGFDIHLDDFCTGYSSMLYLKDLPVDTLKIDKEFTKYIETNAVNENIVRTICTLANNLNLSLVCEGVEHQEQADMVKKMGCRVIQGWLIGKAMPYEEAVNLLEKYNAAPKGRKDR